MDSFFFLLFFYTNTNLKVWYTISSPNVGHNINQLGTKKCQRKKNWTSFTFFTCYKKEWTRWTLFLLFSTRIYVDFCTKCKFSQGWEMVTLGWNCTSKKFDRTFDMFDTFVYLFSNIVYLWFEIQILF